MISLTSYLPGEATRPASSVLSQKRTYSPGASASSDHSVLISRPAESSSGPPRKYYRLTSAGRAAFMTQKREWRAFTDAVNQLIGET